MKNLNSILLAAAMLFAQNVLFAQREADWKVEIPGDANEIFFHTLTGVPIVRGDDYYAGIDVNSKSIKWKIDRSKVNATMAKLGNEETLDFFEVNNSPYAVASNTLVDTRDGKILLDPGADNFKKIKEYELLPDNQVLVTTEGKNNMAFHLIDVKSNSKMWSADLFKLGGGLGRFVTSSSGDEEPKPVKVQVEGGTTMFAQSNRLMIIQNEKEVAMVQASDGTLLWKNKFDPARIFFSPDEKIAYMVEHEKGGMIAQALSAGTKRMGNEISAVDVESGKELWKKPLKAGDNIRWYSLEGDRIWVVSKKGCNVYNTADGTAIWKKDFNEKQIRSIDDNAEGYLIAYGWGKTMQVDQEGKKMWKKPQYPEGEDEEEDEAADFAAYKYDNGTIRLYVDKLVFIAKKDSKFKSNTMTLKPSTKLEYDDARKTILVYDNDNIFLMNPDKYENIFIGRKTRTNSTEIISVEMRKEGYYLVGDQDFIIVKPEGAVIERHYKPPFDGKHFWTSALSTGLAAGSAAYSVSGLTKSMKGSGEMVAGTLNADDDMAQRGGNSVSKGTNQMRTGDQLGSVSGFVSPARFQTFSQTRDYSYFFTKDKAAGEKVLVKVNKDSGEEVDKYIFSSSRPVYKVDEFENRVYYGDKKELQVFEPKS